MANRFATERPPQPTRPVAAGPAAAAAPRTSAAPRPPSRTSARFYACTAILAVTAAAMQLTAWAAQGYLRKAALPLKRPLAELDAGELLPEYTQHREQPPPLDDELLENLGTREYLQWNLVDERGARGDRTALVRLFITYHTGQPDAVPHNPQECRSAAGMHLRSESTIEVPVTGAEGVEVRIPVSVLGFEPPGRQVGLGGEDDGAQQFVAYFFYANGKYVTSRTGVRLAVSNIWDRYAYYSKIEVSFSDLGSRTFANREETIAATRRLLAKLMPILWNDHFQAWAAVNGGRPPVVFEH